MKTILCYGDSNTWGQIPLKNFVKSRYSPEIRWPSLLETLSSQKIRVIEEGNNGRTTGPEDPLRPGRNGLAYLPACLDSAVPLDLTIIMLGTNDLKSKYSPTPIIIASRMRNLIQITKSICTSPPNNECKILLLSPPIIKPEYYSHGDFNYPEAASYSKELSKCYEELAKEEGVYFLDAAKYVTVSDEDGVHLDSENHKKLADIVWKNTQSILNIF